MTGARGARDPRVDAAAAGGHERAAEEDVAALPRTPRNGLARLRNFVGGEWVQAETGATAEVVNPATGDVIAEVPSASAADVDRAVAAAKAALPAWLETTPGERHRMLLKLSAALDDDRDELARLESQNTGKPMPLALDEIDFCRDNLEFFGGAARVLEGRAAGEYLRGYTSWIRREPVGVVGGIAAWNYPLPVAIWKIAPALAAGNVVILKPSELTPLTALRLAELAASIFPRGVLNVITGDGDPVGAALVAHPDVHMVSLTGDVGTGKKVAAGAAATLKRVHLELGGKAPVVVFDDADPTEVAAAVRFAAFTNSGQDCTAAARILAGDAIYDSVVTELVDAVASLRVGDPAASDEVEMGPVISRRQQDRVLGFVDRARAAEAEILIGGQSGGSRGFFVQPTVVAGVDQSHEIVQREVFGPAVTVQRFDDEADAIQWANGVRYGLAASVWTRNIGKALDAARRLEFGVVWINTHATWATEMPHGGFKESGYGKDLSIYAVEEYTRIKHVMARVDA
jgi:1-pyrroline dehydrogenase